MSDKKFFECSNGHVSTDAILKNSSDGTGQRDECLICGAFGSWIEIDGGDT